MLYGASKGEAATLYGGTMEPNHLPAASVLQLMARFPSLRRKGLLKSVIGISGHALKGRVARNPESKLTSQESHLARQLAEIVILATEVIESEDAANVWMFKPAFGLGNMLPLDLMHWAEGIEVVRVCLTRLEFGVYC